MKINALILAVLLFPVMTFANPTLRISATNGFVLVYLKNTTYYYMLSTARIFDRPNGTGINCFAGGAALNLAAVPADGFVFDYWTGTQALSGHVTTFMLPEGGTELEAHFKAVEEPVECPDCTVCEECVTPEPCPECPACPACVCPVIPPCPEIPPCPAAEPCPEVLVPPCPECAPCPKEKDVEGLCFIRAVY